MAAPEIAHERVEAFGPDMMQSLGAAYSTYAGPQVDTSWKNYDLNNGKPVMSLLNTHKWIKNHYKIRRNDFSHDIEVDGKPLDEYMLASMQVAAAENMMWQNPVESMFVRSLQDMGLRDSYNPVIQYFEGLEWDGRKRCETMFVDWLGADDTTLTREMTKKWLVAAVKRTYQPGCKFDNIIILSCEQEGGGKSTIAERLGMGWYSAGVNVHDIKEASMKMSQCLIVGFDELRGMNGKKLELVKNFLSTSADQVRVPWGKRPETFPRHCVFIGTTNETEFLRDHAATCERRFWLVPTTTVEETNKVYEGFTREVVDQIWAEAVASYKADPDYDLKLSKESFKALAELQKGHKISVNDETVDMFRAIMEKEYILDSKNEFVDQNDFLDQWFGRSAKVGTAGKVDRMPMYWISLAMERHWKGSKHYADILRDEYDYKNSRCYGTNQRCFVRKGVTDRRTKDWKGDGSDSVDLMEPEAEQVEQATRTVSEERKVQSFFDVANSMAKDTENAGLSDIAKVDALAGKTKAENIF